MAIVASAVRLGYDYVTSNVCLPDHIPIGSVEYCETILPKKEGMIDFYPNFLKNYLHRKIGLICIGKEKITESLFLKQANKWKSDFESKVYHVEDFIPDGYYYWSKPIEFVQEWRYYFAGGILITTGWYDGVDEDEPAPVLDIIYPEDFNGAVDFGRLKDGKMALVECHDPFACGWYGDDHHEYTFWQYESWIRYIKGK